MTIQSLETLAQHRLIYFYQTPNSCPPRFWKLVYGYVLALDLAFNSKSLRNICENEDEANHELGSAVAQVLKHRLADLRAAISITDIMVGRPRLLQGVIQNKHMIIDLYDNYRMTFCANHPDNPIGENGKIDWQKVSRVKILRIERNYD